MQTATSETESKSLDLSICVHHYTLRAPCPEGQGIQCTRQIETDTVQTSGSCIFSDTVQSSGLGPCASLAAYNSFASFLAKQNTAYLQKHPLPIMFKFCGRRYGLVTAGLHAAIWSKKEEHTARLGRTRPKHHFFRESRSWCFEGSWSLYKRLLPTFLAPPSSQPPDEPLPPHGALSACWPSICVRWLCYIPYTR